MSRGMQMFFILCIFVVVIIAIIAVRVRAQEPEIITPDIVIIPATPAPAPEKITTNDVIIPEPPEIPASSPIAQKSLWPVGVPLSENVQSAIRGACLASCVPYYLALGLIDGESGFQPDAVSETGCYGLCQLSGYFKQNLTPEENVTAGIAFLGSLLCKYETVPAALTAYNQGHDTGDRVYANYILEKAKAWEDAM